jgi:hypothetical protein
VCEDEYALCIVPFGHMVNAVDASAGVDSKAAVPIAAAMSFN